MKWDRRSGEAHYSAFVSNRPEGKSEKGVDV